MRKLAKILFLCLAVSCAYDTPGDSSETYNTTHRQFKNDLDRWMVCSWNQKHKSCFCGMWIGYEGAVMTWAPENTPGCEHQAEASK